MSDKKVNIPVGDFQNPTDLRQTRGKRGGRWSFETWTRLSDCARKGIPFLAGSSNAARYFDSSETPRADGRGFSARRRPPNSNTRHVSRSIRSDFHILFIYCLEVKPE